MINTALLFITFIIMYYVHVHIKLLSTFDIVSVDFIFYIWVK